VWNYISHELVGMCVLVRLPRVIGAGVSVNGSALVFCGHDMWFLDGHNMCAIFLCTVGAPEDGCNSTQNM
jgi:hypothetical protein